MTQANPAGPPADGRFAVVASEERFRGRIFSARIDTVTMPGGGHARREIVEHARAVAVVALDDAGQVVLIEQYRHPLRRRLWEIPAGLMDVPGEEPLACAQREFREEVGLGAENWSVLIDFASSPGYSTEAVRVYLARGLTPASDAPMPDADRPADEEADLRIVRVPLGEAVRAVFDGRIVNVSAVAGLLAADRAVRRADDVTVDDGDAAVVLRPGDDRWTDSPALVADIAPGDEIGAAPDLGRARSDVTPDPAPGG